MEPAPTIHGSCVRVDGMGVLIRGASGSGKSTLALRLILDPPRALPPAELVADDRVRLELEGGALLASPPDELAGMIEMRYLGLRRLPYFQRVPLHFVLDLDAPDAERLPRDEGAHVILQGQKLFRIAVPRGFDAALLLAAALRTQNS
ncbi:HPr kinase/phosphatase C-terminal domain-containing protein [Aquabacter sp. CN5-332]|uniref:HPr kinase/phosphorylase n=1 Tax=Aquabacter sp. CN5-332 TaxID=3156608 RepID=UPI0032B3CB54